MQCTTIHGSVNNMYTNYTKTKNDKNEKTFYGLVCLENFIPN